MKAESVYEKLVDLLNENTININLENQTNFTSIIEGIGNARIVLMGEATHGTVEFYQTRIALSKILIEKKGFHAIAIEGDWPSTYHLHQYIQGEEDDIEKTLDAFKRFPTWMWRNSTIPPLLSWLREFNKSLPSNNQIGFYGLDLYSLEDSMRSIIQYLQKHDLESAQKAITRYKCFDGPLIEPQLYGYFVNKRLRNSCVKEVTEQFLEMQHRTFIQLNRNFPNDEALYYATQNARLVKNAEEYYRAMFESRNISWNIRDRHMAQTLSNLITHIETKINAPAKIIVWAHNSHVGDARATEMQDREELNLGQVVREEYNAASYLLGFSTYKGTVRAASEWDGESEIKKLLPALEGSYESLFHEAATTNFFLNLRSESHLIKLLTPQKLQRAVGVIYLPESERLSHYYFSCLPYQFDGLIHFDESHALTSLDSGFSFLQNDFPDTYPTGI